MSVLCSRFGVLLMIAAADASCQLGIPRRPRQQQIFRIIKHDWTSHQLVSEVAAILLEEVLMYDIDRVSPHISPVHDFRAISMGSADANFEVWQGGKDEQIGRWVRDGRAIVAGHHRVSGVSGIFTLKHTVDRFPHAQFHQNLGSPELQWLGAGNASMAGELAADPENLCSRAEWQCKNYTWLSPSCRHDGMNCKGQVLHDYSHYTQGILEQQIANNNLPLSVTYLSPTSKEAQVWKAFASKRDVLFQHYTPSPGVDGVPAASFVPVQFPPKKYGCNFTQTTTPAGRFGCHLEEQPLVSVISPAFQSSPEAAHFAAHFSLEKEDYEKLFEAWKDTGSDPNLAACKWLKEAGISRWGRWIKFSRDRPLPMFREFPPTHGCFPTCYAFLLLTLGTALIFKKPDLVEKVMRCLRGLAAPAGQLEADALQFRDLEKPVQAVQDQASFLSAALPSKLSVCRHMDFVQVKMALQRELSFLGFFRDEHNFCRENGEGTVPPPAYSGYRQYCHTPGEVLVYFLTSGLVRMSLSAITYACATGVVGALLAEVQSTRRQEQALYPIMEAVGGYEQFLANLRRVTGTMDEFKFLPTFFITYMVGQDVSRWLQWLRTMFSVQGRLHDVTLVIASSYRKLNDPVAGKIQRQRLFRWYRYLNAIHYLAYFKLDSRVGKSPEQVLMELRSVGLLLDGEAQQLVFASSKLRDTLVSWLGALWHEELAADSVQAADTEIFMRKVCDLRGILASLADMPDMQTSQLMRVMMIVVTNILLALALVGYPTKMYADTEQCFQFWPLVASYLYFICFRGMLRVMFILDKGPFFPNGDCVNVDALLTSTERFTFHVFRTSFKPLKPESKAIHLHRIGALDKLPPAAVSEQGSN